MLRLSIILIFALNLNCSRERSRDEPTAAPGLHLAGGSTTTWDRSADAYTFPAPNLDDDSFALHMEGDRAFEALFVTAPAPLNPGLGPVFNNASCNGCHIRNGRGMPSLGQGALRSQLLVRVSLNDPAHIAASDHGAPVPVPGLGGQIQDHAILGFTPEAEIRLSWESVAGVYPDGAIYTLRRPKLDIALPDGSPLPSQVMTSLRMPPPVFGLGLLEAISEQAILDLKAEQSKTSAETGISGATNLVWDPVQNTLALGRFGWKSNTSTLLVQAAAAYVNDMGVTNPIFPEADGRSEIDQKTLDAAAQYSQTLAVPRSSVSESTRAQEGEQLFDQIGCASCHRPTWKTGDHPIAALANQTIHPYTDMLLHDMGDELADNRPDFQATGREWRTTPLWGIGLTQTVLPQTGFLHDGRARTLEEAILWHGGEGDASRQKFKNLSAFQREAVLEFLHHL